MHIPERHAKLLHSEQMPEQFSFPGFESPKLTDRLFFAVLPDASSTAKIGKLAAEIRRSFGLHGKPIDGIRLHVTLLFLGDYAGLPRDVVAAVQDRAARLRVHSFTARFDRLSSFSGKPGHRPLVLLGSEDMAGFDELYLGLLQELNLKRAAPPAKKLTPHITLMYDQYLADVDVEPIQWLVDEFVLLHSSIGTGRPYEVLGRWALQN